MGKNFQSFADDNADVSRVIIVLDGEYREVSKAAEHALASPLFGPAARCILKRGGFISNFLTGRCSMELYFGTSCNPRSPIFKVKANPARPVTSIVNDVMRRFEQAVPG